MKPNVPEFNDEVIIPSFTTPGGPADTPAGDMSAADTDNYAPTGAQKAQILCLTCANFWLRKHIAATWSTRSAGNQRKIGVGSCLFTTPPTSLQGEYVTDCNQYTARIEVAE